MPVLLRSVSVAQQENILAGCAGRPGFPPVRLARVKDRRILVGVRGGSERWEDDAWGSRVPGRAGEKGVFCSILRSTDCHFQESCDSLSPPHRSGLAARWNETYRSAASIVPCPRISPEVRPKSPHLSRLRPAPSPVPRVQDHIIILIRRNPRWVRRFMSVGCPTRRPSRS